MGLRDDTASVLFLHRLMNAPTAETLESRRCTRNQLASSGLNPLAGTVNLKDNIEWLVDEGG
jgi:hypothetical protein